MLPTEEDLMKIILAVPFAVPIANPLACALSSIVIDTLPNPAMVRF